MLRFWSITAIFTLLSHRYICRRLSGESIQICRFTYYTCLLLLDHYRELIKQSLAAYVNEVINIWTRWDVSEVARMEKSKRGNSKSTQFCLFLINPKSSLALFHRLHKKIGYLKSSGDIFKSNAISHIKIQSQPQFVSAGLRIPEEILAQGGHQRTAQWRGGVGGPQAPWTRYYSRERYGGHAVRHFIAALKARPCNFILKKQENRPITAVKLKLQALKCCMAQFSTPRGSSATA